MLLCLNGVNVPAFMDKNTQPARYRSMLQSSVVFFLCDHKLRRMAVSSLLLVKRVRDTVTELAELGKVTTAKLLPGQRLTG